MKAEVAVVGNGVGYAYASRLASHGVRPLLVGPGLPVDRVLPQVTLARPWRALPEGELHSRR